MTRTINSTKVSLFHADCQSRFSKLTVDRCGGNLTHYQMQRESCRVMAGRKRTERRTLLAPQQCCLHPGICVPTLPLLFHDRGQVSNLTCRFPLSLQQSIQLGLARMHPCVTSACTTAPSLQFRRVSNDFADRKPTLNQTWQRE